MKIVSAVLVASLAAGVVITQADAQIVQSVTGCKARFGPGEPVRIDYTIANPTSRPVTYQFSSSKLFDVWITRGGTEVYRLSRGSMYLTVMTSLTLQPSEKRAYQVTWDQKDTTGKQVGPGVYDIHAQLTPTGNQPPPVTAQVSIGSGGAANVPMNISDVITNADHLMGRRVSIAATYQGFQPKVTNPNVSDGPPVTRSDWTICDSTGCMYVTGSTHLDPEKDVGRKVNVTGNVHRTPKGQIYLVLTTVTVAK